MRLLLALLELGLLAPTAPASARADTVRLLDPARVPVMAVGR